ncbi:MAG: peptidase C15 [Leptolyngbyaceae cyanobacterium]
MSLLLTSFSPWKAHQVANASDTLLGMLQQRELLPKETKLIRQLPVHFQLAPGAVIAALYQYRPQTVVCCGMAETRSLLNIERYATGRSDRLETSIHLPSLCAGLEWTAISHDAGSFVCNTLYHRLLAHINEHRLTIQCLFIHVPPLASYNQEPVIQDIAVILERLCNDHLTLGNLRSGVECEA